jgi:hypothetical protein
MEARGQRSVGLVGRGGAREEEHAIDVERSSRESRQRHVSPVDRIE